MVSLNTEEQFKQKAALATTELSRSGQFCGQFTKRMVTVPKPVKPLLVPKPVNAMTKPMSKPLSLSLIEKSFVESQAVKKNPVEMAWIPQEPVLPMPSFIGHYAPPNSWYSSLDHLFEHSLLPEPQSSLLSNNNFGFDMGSMGLWPDSILDRDLNLDWPLVEPLKQETACENCEATVTPIWRRGPSNETLCNACGLFMKLHGTHRPKNMKPHGGKKTSLNTNMECVNCKTRSTPLWRKDDSSNPLCNSCGLFWKQHHQMRPISLQDTSRRRHRLDAMHINKKLK